MASNGKKIILCLVQIANIRADELEKKKKHERGGSVGYPGLKTAWLQDKSKYY